MQIKQFLRSWVMAAVVGTLAGTAHADYPDRPIRLVVPFAAGGTLATDMVAKAAPDGYTLLMTTNSHTANPSIYARLSYDTKKDFVSVAMIGDLPGLLVASPFFAPNTFKEFIEYARSARTPVSYGTAGAGTYPHLTTELLRSRAQIEMTHIPYRGAGPAMNDLLAGVYNVKVEGVPTAMQHVKSGKLKVYAVTSRERIPSFPEVPTIAELGFSGFESTFWMAMLAPAGTPKDIVGKLERALIEALQDKEVTARLAASGIRVIAGPATQVDELIERELVQWPPIVKQANIQVN